MPGYISAKEFRQRFSEISEDLKRFGDPSDLLDRASTINDSGQMDLQEISRIVHDLRGVK